MNRETKSNQHFVWFMITIAFVMAILLIGKAVYGQTQNNYGIADFSRRDAYPKDGLVFDANFLTAQPEGDLTQGLGDMETWVAGCPSGFLCVNLGAGSFAQETAKLYKNNSSAKLTVDGAGSTTSYTYPMSYEANAYYQISFRYKGEAGAETIDCGAHNLALSEFYDFTAHTWGAPSIVFLTATTSWKTANLYMDVGAVAKASYYFSIGRASGINPSQVFYIDDLQIRKLKKGGPFSGPSNVTMTVNGDPSFDSQNAKNSFRGQPGNWGTTFDGTTDYLSYPDTGDTFDPCSTGKECQYTMACNFNPTTYAVTQSVISKDLPAASRSYELLIIGGTLQNYTFSVVGYTSVTCAAITAGLQTSVVTKYKGITEGTSLLDIQCNNAATVSSATAGMPVINSTAIFGIANRDGADAPFSGSIYHCSYYNKYFDSIDASKWINPYFPANNNNRGFYVSTCTQAASHATCSWDTCRDGTPHACQAEETGSMAVFDTKTELIPYNSFETVTGDDSAPTFTGWTTSSYTTAYRNETNHGNISVRIKISGAGTLRDVLSTCIPISPATTYYMEASVKSFSPENFVSLGGYEFTDGACSAGGTQRFFKIPMSVGSNFAVDGGSLTSLAGTNSIQLFVRAYNVIPTFQDILIDSVSLKAGSYRTPWVHNPGVGSVSYNRRDYKLNNVLVEPKPDGSYPYTAGWCAGMWVYTDWAGDDGVSHGIFEIPPTAGSNNRVALGKNSANELSFNIYDSAGLRMNYYVGSLTNTKWTAGGYKYIEGCTSNTGTVMMHYYNANNSTWYTAIPSPAGTGIQDGQTNYINIGYTAFFAAYFDGYISNICFAPFSASYSNCAWNSGNPPKRPY